MGKSLPSPTRLKEFVRVATSKSGAGGGSGGLGGGDSQKLKLTILENPQIPNRMPLSEAVSDCTKRWSQEAGENPSFQNRFFKPETSTSGGGGSRDDSEKLKLNMENQQTLNRMPLSEVVSDCAKRWFQDTLKDAKAGDINMQVLVGQMYFSGYGVTTDAHKGRAWITRAARRRSSVWKVSDKRPGYHASDSDSDELMDDVK